MDKGQAFSLKPSSLPPQATGSSAKEERALQHQQIEWNGPGTIILMCANVYSTYISKQHYTTSVKKQKTILGSRVEKWSFPNMSLQRYIITLTFLKSSHSG